MAAKVTKGTGKGPPKPQDWSGIFKDATPEDVARALLRPLKPRPQPTKRK